MDWIEPTMPPTTQRRDVRIAYAIIGKKHVAKRVTDLTTGRVFYSIGVREKKDHADYCTFPPKTRLWRMATLAEISALNQEVK